MSTRQQYRLIEHFVAGTTARAASQIIGVQATTAARFYMRLRTLIASKLPSYELYGQVEADESYFGGRRKGMRGRGAAGKIAVFGLLKLGGKVYTALIPNAKTQTLMPIIEEHVRPDSIVYTDTFRCGVSTTRSCLPIRRITSMGSIIFGTKPSVTCADLMG